MNSFSQNTYYYNSNNNGPKNIISNTGNISTPNKYMNSTGYQTTEDQSSSLLISQLKTKIFDLEQNMNNYNNLQQKYNKLQNENELLTREKLDLEYQLKQKNECLTKTITDLQNENECLKNEIKEKQLTNKKLFDDNNTLIKELEDKCNTIDCLNKKQQERDCIIEELTQSNKDLMLKINQLNDINSKNENYIIKLENNLE